LKIATTTLKGIIEASQKRDTESAAQPPRAPSRKGAKPKMEESPAPEASPAEPSPLTYTQIYHGAHAMLLLAIVQRIQHQSTPAIETLHQLLHFLEEEGTRTSETSIQSDRYI